MNQAKEDKPVVAIGCNKATGNNVRECERSLLDIEEGTLVLCFD